MINLVNFLHRTSTYRIYQLILEERKESTDYLANKMLKLGHRRTQSDIRSMKKLLYHFGLLDESIKEKVKLLIKGDYFFPPDSLVYVANNFIDQMMEKGLLIRPFLEAVQAFPNRNRMIQYELVDRCKNYGYYDQRIGDDISAAMRNFTSMLGLTKPYTKRGIYELTTLGEKVVAIEREENSRITCKAGEPCREVCPTGAIGAYKINLNCIACGLCVDTCPYGALTIDCHKSPQLQFNAEICTKSKGIPGKAQLCNTNKLLGEELSLQRWIKQVLMLVGITSEIPGVGEFPDLVTLEEPAFIEVKRTRITQRNAKQLEEQIARYAEQRIITSTLEQLKRFSDLNWQYPEYMLILSPDGGYEKMVVKNLQNKLEAKTIGFISLNRFFTLLETNFRINKVQREPILLTQLL